MHKKLSGTFILMALITFGIIWQIGQRSSKQTLKVGIIQLVEHEALDSSRLGFIEGLKESECEGDIIYKNASDDLATCSLIANQFVSEGCSLILAIATPAAQSTAAVTSKIPILITPITNPEDVGLVKSNEKPGVNVTGTSDLPPVAKQIKLIKDLKPETKKIGILFSSREANSKYQAEIAFEEAEKIGFNPEFFTFSQMTEIQQVMETIPNDIDAIYTPTDNMVASNMELISKIALSKKMPVVCSDENLVCKGAVGTFGIDYFQLGKLTAKQAIKILKGETSPESMPIEYLEDVTLTLNRKVLEELRIIVPEELKEKVNWIF